MGTNKAELKLNLCLPISFPDDAVICRLVIFWHRGCVRPVQPMVRESASGSAQCVSLVGIIIGAVRIIGARSDRNRQEWTSTRECFGLTLSS